MIKLYVIDDHYLIIEGLYTSFDLDSDDFEVAGGSLSIPAALQEIDPEKVDIILLDLFIKQTDPLINLLTIRKAFPSIPVVILSSESCIYWQVEMFRHGVKAYINKGEDQSEMCQKLKRVCAGEVNMPDEVVRILFMSNDSEHTANYFSDQKEIITGLSRGMSIRDLAEKMRQTVSAIDKKLRLMRKSYNAKTNTELVVKALNSPIKN
ncbi:MAG: response regulator transcription factor [Bacteroidota bacterium]